MLVMFAPDILPGVLLMCALVMLMPSENENGAPKNNQGQDFTWGLQDPPGGEEGKMRKRIKSPLGQRLRPGEKIERGRIKPPSSPPLHPGVKIKPTRSRQQEMYSAAEQ